MKDIARFVATAVVAGAVPPVLLDVVIALNSHVGLDGAFLLKITLVLCLIGTAAGALIVVPAFAVLEERGWLNALTVSIIGAGEAILPLAALGLFKDMVDGTFAIQLLWVPYAAIIMIAGVFAGWVAWRRLG
jgi:hypothetical protein